MWMQVKSVPEDQWVLVVGPAGVVEVGKLFYQRGVAYWDTGKHKVHKYAVFTHWMPLPEPPVTCADCGEALEEVRPGKHQHVGDCVQPNDKVSGGGTPSA